MKAKEQAGRASIWMAVLMAWMFAAAHTKAQTPGPSPSPSWWSSYGVISGTNVADYAAVNQGQARNMALAAVYELDNDLAQFGGSGLDGLTTTVLSGTSPQEADYAALSHGQLKWLVKPFYDRLLSLGYTGGPLTSGTYPWTGGTPTDYAISNIGELKFLFSFDVTYSATGDSVPDWWIQKYFPGQSMTSGSSTLWDSQVTLSQAYQQGLNPVNFYDGQTPMLAIISGNGLTGSSGGFVPGPLTVAISNSAGPLIGAPVSFTVVTTGSLWQTNLQTLPSPVTLLTDQNGQAKVYFQLPNSQNTTCTIVATATTASGQPQVSGTFTESSDGGSGSYINPFAPSNVVANMNPDGSVDVSWSNNCDPNDPTLIDIQYKDPSGSWVDCVENLPAGTTSYHVPPQ